MSFCPSCGTKLEEGSKFCNKCGAAVNQQVNSIDPGVSEAFSRPTADYSNVNTGEQNIHHKQKKPGKKIYIIGIVAAAVLVLIGAAAIFTNGFASLRAMYNINMGNNYIAEGKYEEAIPAFEQAVGIDEKNIDSKLKLSDLYIKDGRDDKAETLLKETLPQDDTNQNIYIQLAGIYERGKNYEELLKLFNDGLSICSEKDKLQEEFDSFVSEINIPDIEASVELGEAYSLPDKAQVEIGEDSLLLSVDWKGQMADTSKAGAQKLEGTIQNINKPISVNLNVEIKPAVVTGNEMTEEGQYYNMVYNVPVVSLEGRYADNAAKLNSAIMEYFNKVKAENAQIASEISPDDLIDPNIKYEFDAGYSVYYNKDGLISITLTYYSFTGGAHGSTYRVAYNYDLINGKELQLQDLFSKDADANDTVKQEIITQMQGNEEFSLFDSANSIKNYPKPFNFYFTEEGIVVWFDEYEIASYSAGMPEFLITKDVAIK